MGRALRLAVMGVPVGGGGLPTSITDDFSADSGKWLDGDLAAAAITVASGRGIWTPTRGAQLHTAANAASDPNGNEANATTGWAFAGTGSVEAVDVYVGDYALKVVALDTNSERMEQTFTCVLNTWYEITLAAKKTVGTQNSLFGWTGVELPTNPTDITADWTEYAVTNRCTNTSFPMRLYACRNAGAIGDDFLADNISLRPLTAADMYRVQRVYYVSDLSVKIRRRLNTGKGVIYLKDINNWIKLWTTGGGQIKMLKRVAGVVSAELGSANVVYAADAVLGLRPNAAFTVFDGLYAGSKALADIAINDFAADVSGGRFTVPWYVGLFNTHNSGDIDVDAFDDFSAVKL